MTTDVKLLLSTCGTGDRAFQAIAYEMHAWCGSFKAFDPRSFSFGDMVYGARTAMSPHGTGKLQDDVIKRLYWSVVFVTAQ